MQKVKIESFQVIGISIRTTNENNQGAGDIGQLWQKFMSEGIIDKIPNKIDNTIYSIYTNYELDHTGPYDTILACKVTSIESVPEGMIAHNIEGGTYAQFIDKGVITKGLIHKMWMNIWGVNMDRKYTSDFEIYSEKAQNPMDAEVEILVALEN